MFIEEMYDWGIDKIREYMYDNSRNDFLHIRYTWQELGLDAKWYEQQCRDLNYDWRLINREVNLQWTRTADNAVFDEIQMEELNRIIRAPISNYLVRVKERLHDENVETLRDYAFKLYHELDRTKEYAIGVDVAAGLDKDFSTIVITDPAEDFNIVGIFKSPIIDTYSLTMLLITLIKHHLPNSTLFIENNSYGKAVIDTCLKYIKDRVYTYYIAPPKKAHKQKVGKDEGKVQYGINNNTSTRPIMMEILRKTVVDSMWMLAYDDLYNEIKGLEYTRDNKIEHGANTHDDVLMAYLIVRYAFANTPNISKYFRGIYSLSEANKPSKETDPAKNLGVTIDIDAVLAYIQNGMTMEEALAQYNKDLEGDNNRVNHKLAGELLRKK